MAPLRSRPFAALLLLLAAGAVLPGRPAGGRCASACALAWLGGTPRVMVQGSAVGFHAAYTVEGGQAATSGAGNALIGAYLAGLGLRDRAIVYITMARPDQMTW